MEVVPDPDIVVVCCGGGGLVAGIAAGLKLSGCDRCRIYAVEPTGGKKKVYIYLLYFYCITNTIVRSSDCYFCSRFLINCILVICIIISIRIYKSIKI